MDRTVGEGAGLQSGPASSCRIYGGFYHDGDVGCTGDGEAKQIAPYTSSLRLRVPEREEKPARSSRQIIDNWRGPSSKIEPFKSTKCRVVALEIHASQAGSVTAPTRQVIVVTKRSLSDADNASRNDHATQIGAGSKRPRPNISHTIWDCVGSHGCVLALRVLE
jgi:hypothetical protein